MSDQASSTLTFLFTDIEGSTRLWEQHPAAMSAALERHDRLIKAAIGAYDGQVFKTVGDAFYTIFAVAPSALKAAAAIQRALLAESWPATGPLKVRIALHTGATQERDGDYFGPTLNRVARLLAAGHGGQILISQPTYELVRDHLPAALTLRDLGERRLKDMFRPEHVYQVLSYDLPAEFPPLKTLDVRPTNLPAQPTPFIGREREVATACGLVRQPAVRLLTFTGPGGTGKTRLSLQVAADLLDEFEHGVFFVPLDTISDPAAVPGAIARSIAVHEQPGDTLLETLKHELAHQELLLVLDNFEQVVAAAPVITALLSAAPRLKALVSSRIILHVYGEREFAVQPLELPDPAHLPSIQQLSQFEAVRLFIERAQAVRNDFAVTSENAPAVAEICVQLDGLPLAIELAAARSKFLAPQAILARLRSRLKLLTGGARDLPARQQTLQGAIDWSYNLLTASEQMLFARLAVCVGGCSVEAAEAVCLPADPAMDVLERLITLADNSLLRQSLDGQRNLRFAMLETIREYALERLRVSGQLAATQELHAGYFRGLAEQAEAGLGSPQQVTWLRLLEQDYANLQAALHWYEATPDQAEAALRMAAGLGMFWIFRHTSDEARRHLDTILALPLTRQYPAAQAKVLNIVGRVAYDSGDYAASRIYLKEGVAIARLINDPALLSNVLINLGHVAREAKQVAEAEACYQESLELRRGLGDLLGMAHVLTSLGELRWQQGQFEAGHDLLIQSHQLHRESGDTWGLATSLSYYARHLTMHGPVDRALAPLLESLELYQQLGISYSIARNYTHLGYIYLKQTQYLAAHTALREALRLITPAEEPGSVAECLLGFAVLAATHSQPLRTMRWRTAAEQLRATFKQHNDGWLYSNFTALLPAVRHGSDSAATAPARQPQSWAQTLDEVLRFDFQAADQAD